jgi:hypothetical protein
VGNENNTLLEFDTEGNFIWQLNSEIDGWEVATCLTASYSDHLGIDQLYIGGVRFGDFCLINYDLKPNDFLLDEDNYKLIWNRNHDINPPNHPMEYNTPGLGMDSSGNTVIAYKWGYEIRVTKYDSVGNQLWNIFYHVGSGLNYPAIFIDINFDSNDDIYVAAYFNGTVRLIKFRSNDGQFQWFRGFGTDLAGYYYQYLSLEHRGSLMAIDSNDYIYLAVNNIIFKITPTGSFSTFSAPQYILQLAIDSLDRIFLICETYWQQVFVFNTQFQFIKVLYFNQEYLTYQSSIAIDSNNDIYITFGDKIQKYQYETDLLLYEISDIYPIEAPFFPPRPPYPYPQEITIDRYNNLYVVSGNNIWKFNSEGRLQSKFNSGTICDKIIVDEYKNLYLTTNTINNIYELRKYASKIPLNIKFSLKKDHFLKENSRFKIKISNLKNPYVNSYLNIENEAGVLYGQFLLPYTSMPTDVVMELPIFTNKLHSESYIDGKTYHDTLVLMKMMQTMI